MNEKFHKNAKVEQLTNIYLNREEEKRITKDLINFIAKTPQVLPFF